MLEKVTGLCHLIHISDKNSRHRVDMMGRRFGTLALLVCIATPAAAQQHGTGFVALSKSDYAAQPHAVRARSATFLSAVDLSSYFPDVGDQSFQGSCTAWAVSYAARSYYLAAISGHKPVLNSDISSPAYVFNSSTSHADSNGVFCGGASLKSALDVVASQGTTSLARMPYSAKSCIPAPGADDQRLALQWKVPGWDTIPAEGLKTPDAYREMLERGIPVMIGTFINHAEWENNHSTAVYTLGANSVGDPATDKTFTGHAMVIVGYDDNKIAANGEKGAFKVMNSWGKGFADRGFVWASYKSLLTLVQEAYVFKGVVPPMMPREGIMAPITAGNAATVPTAMPVAPPPPFNAQPVAPKPATPASVTPAPVSPQPVQPIYVVPPPPPVAAAQPDLSAALASLAANVRTGEVRVARDGDTYRLTGYGCVDEVEYLRVMASKYGQRVSFDVEGTPWPACEIRGILKDAVSRPGVDAHVVNLEPDAPPQVRGVQITEDDAPLATTAIMRNGDRFEIDAEVQDQAPYVQIYYLQADQSVKEIWRGEIRPDGSGRRRLSIGGATSKIKLTASRPYGTEAVLVLAGQGVMSPATMEHNTSEVGFMDHMRGDLGAAIQNDPSIRAQIVQVEVRDNPNPSDDWLVTPSEYQTIAAGDALSATDPAVVTRGDFFGPQITVDPASLVATGGKLVLKAGFRQGWGSTIRPETVRVEYRTQTGWKDVTDRVRAAGQITAQGITTTGLSLPDGRHRLRLSVQDIRGHSGVVELNFKTGS